MASKAVAKVAGGVMDISTKQTVQSKGIWERFRRAAALCPERSNGVPLNPYFRNPPPGSNDPNLYDDPVTVPAGDIAGNPYWQRDARRSYPRRSVVGQADAVALLAVGSAAHPKTELVGEAGQKALVAAREEGEKEEGLGGYLVEKNKDGEVAKDLFVNGMPPLPSGQSLSSGKWDVHKYRLSEQSYDEGYPCRSFS